MSIGQFCIRDTVIVKKDDTIVEAAKVMREHHVGSVVVVEESEGGCKPLGILTDRDLVVEILAEEVAPDAVTVGDIMSFELVTAREQDGLWETLQRMRANGVRRIPVVDDRGVLVGIISADDYLEILSAELGELAKLLGREKGREERTRGG
ncbi:CBS domain-containing protein [Methylococcus sp. ANG]|jgi:CBS domain-containing protein|uniref:CBS domain-containing protein n=1 Tax=unclassified Methylococcus TaxID=2618889 RepID=UPI001C52E8BD|nr:CBS domain-containing protein [Methylococcus sp. Mc7]QXP84627.1 CBS domain-containing protein [Methylococcus sp. Mc7]